MQTNLRKNKEYLNLGQRGAEMVIIFVMLLFAAFLIYHQWAHTGFFTEQFGQLEMICLYGPLALAFLPPLVRALAGRRNPARPFEVLANVCQALGALWLLTVFPFSFPHLADALPLPIHFVLAWMTDDIGRLLLIFQIVVVSIAAIATALQFLFVLRREVLAHSSSYLA